MQELHCNPLRNKKNEVPEALISLFIPLHKTAVRIIQYTLPGHNNDDTC